MGGSRDLAPNPKPQPAPGGAVSPPCAPPGAPSPGARTPKTPRAFGIPAPGGFQGGPSQQGSPRQSIWGGVRCSPQALTPSFLCDSKSGPGASCSHAATGLAEATGPRRDGHVATGAPGRGGGTGHSRGAAAHQNRPMGAAPAEEQGQLPGCWGRLSTRPQAECGLSPAKPRGRELAGGIGGGGCCVPLPPGAQPGTARPLWEQPCQGGSSPRAGWRWGWWCTNPAGALPSLPYSWGRMEPCIRGAPRALWGE